MEFPDIHSMTPRELVRGLMRGARDEFKLGYTAENAVSAVSGLKALTAEGIDDLSAYAAGFADGMAEPHDRVYPARRSLDQ